MSHYSWLGIVVLAAGVMSVEKKTEAACTQVATPLCSVLEKTYQNEHLIRTCHVQLQIYLEQTYLYLECLSQNYQKSIEQQKKIVDRFNCGLSNTCELDHTTE